jgi:PAS domain-containing protein
MDHCNGLLLCDIKRGSELCACNPATSRWTLLPRPPGADFRYHHYAGAYIAFDPAESPHFQVVLVPAVPKAPTPEHRRKKEKERRAQLWEEEGDAPFCLDWFFAVADGGAAIGEEETEADKERRAQLWEEERGASFCLDWFFAMADGGAAIGDEEEIGVYHDEEFQQLPSSSVDEDLERDIDPWRLMEWPPTPWTLHVFSSRAGHWEERAFVREGMPAGTVEKMRLDREEPTIYGPRRRYAIYHHGSLYVHCHGSFVTRYAFISFFFLMQ